jgi:hypothetical protein
MEARMTDRDLLERLRTHGADLARWPDRQAQARAALLADREFRLAYEEERALDRRLLAERDSIDQEIARSGALDRVRRAALAGGPSNALAGIRWPRIAAAILVAGVLGGAVDMLLPAAADEPIEVAIGDPLYSLGADAE